MASAEQRPSGRWRGIWRDRDGRKQHSPGIYLTKNAALSYAIDQEEQADLGHATARSTVTWSEWKVIWLLGRWADVAASTRDGDEARIRKWIEPRWGAVQIGRITTPDLRAWVRDLIRQGVSPGLIAKIYHLLSASLRDAVEAETLLANPCRDVKLPEPAPGHERFFEPEEIDAIVGWMNHPYSTAVILMVETGLRFGELAGLHWQRVEWSRQQLDIVEAWSRAGSAIKPYPKSRRRRTVPLSDRALEILNRLPRARGTCGQRHDGGVRCRSTLVLPSPEGLPLDSHNMRDRHWLPALELADLDHGRQHDLRHTYASWLAQAGVPLGDIAAALGHSDAYVTQRYKHLANRHLGRVRDAMNAVRSVPSSVPSRHLEAVQEP